MKWLIFKVVFIYPRIYSFFHYYRKKESRKEFEDKAALFYSGYALNSTTAPLTYSYYMVIYYNYVSLIWLIIFLKYQPVSSNLVEQTAYPLIL